MATFPRGRAGDAAPRPHHYPLVPAKRQTHWFQPMAGSRNPWESASICVRELGGTWPWWHIFQADVVALSLAETFNTLPYFSQKNRTHSGAMSIACSSYAPVSGFGQISA